MNSFQTASQRAQARRERGGALVEFALLNIVLVPLLLYAIFLMDAAYLKLDLQETVVSGVWDFSQRNSEPPAGGDAVGAANTYKANNGMELQATAKPIRIVYSDHTSAFDDGAEIGVSGYGEPARLRGNGNGDPNSPGGHMRHHTGFGAQYTFRFKPPPPNEEEDDEEGTHTGGALDGVGTELDTQFKCRIVEDLGWAEPGMREFGQSGYNAGGEARCDSIAFIYNYIIPEKYMQEFSETEGLTKLKRRRDLTSDKAHEYQGQGGREGNIVAHETAAISFNTWALRNGASQRQEPSNGYGAQAYSVYDGKVAGADIGTRSGLLGTTDDPKDNPFFRRVQYMYSSNGQFAATYANIATRAGQFMNKATLGGDRMITTYAAPILPGLPVPPSVAPLVGVPNIAGVFMTARYQPNQRGIKQGEPSLFGGSGTFQSTPYAGHNSNYPTAAGNRGQFYMGCKTQETPNCF